MGTIRNRRSAPDPWRHELAAPGEEPGGGLGPGDVIVSLARWAQERPALIARPGRTGVRLEPGDDVRALEAADLAALAAIEIAFGSVAEGRGYSQARLLRRRGYGGDLRAVGDVSRDRLAFMERCGFNVFVLREDEDVDSALAAFTEIDGAYQPDSLGGVFHARRRGLRPPRCEVPTTP